MLPYLIFSLLMTIKVVFCPPLTFPCNSVSDLFPVSVGQCYTNFERGEYRVHMGWDVCLMDLIQRALWEFGMQHRHGVLRGLSACASRASQKTHCYSHTLPAATDLTPLRPRIHFYNCTYVRFYSNIMLLQNTVPQIILRC